MTDSTPGSAPPIFPAHLARMPDAPPGPES